MKKILLKGGFIILMTALLAACDGGTSPTGKTTHTHQWGAWSVTNPATCTTKGVETRVCTLDATHKDTRDIPLVAHDWEQLSGTAPTCTADGNGTRKCNLCSIEETLAVIPALGHDFGNWTVTTPATCTTAGVETATCSHDSSHTTTRAIPIAPNAHDWQQLSGTAPTCTTDGSGTRKCKLCSIEETLDVIPALGHNYAWVKTTAPTCTTAGVETGTCSHDSSHTTTNPIPINPTAHNWKNNWVITTPPTIAQGGIETDTCTLDASHARTRSITAATFNTVAGLGTYLSGLSDNTAATAYTVKLNVSSLGGDVSTTGSVGKTLSDYNVNNGMGGALSGSTKYVVLDLSGSTLTTIEENAFDGCASLVSVIIPNSVTGIGYNAFNRCISLTSVTFPVNANFTSIGGFQSCAKLTSIIIPNSVTTIEGSAFNRCTGLTSVTIPRNVTSIGDWAFGNNTNLASVTFEGTIAAANFSIYGAFFGDLQAKFYATNPTNGTPGTYTTDAPASAASVWTKK